MGKKRNVVITFFFHMSVFNFSLEHQFLFISYILYISPLWEVWTGGEVKPSNEIFSLQPCLRDRAAVCCRRRAK